MELTPREIVVELDKHIIGQTQAKRAVAIALRNRYRRSKLPVELRDEITPKNIIMIGPTGVGKTEIARRLAKLVDAPFIKVEATKFTEVGYVGRDVDSMVRDLVETAIRMVKQQKFESVQTTAHALAEKRLVDILMPNQKNSSPPTAPFFGLLGAPAQQAPKPTPEEANREERERTAIWNSLRSGAIEDQIVEIEVEDTPMGGLDMLAGAGIDINIMDVFGGILPKKTKIKKVPIKEARKIFEQEESNKLIDMDEVTTIAIQKAEQDGIIFLDEIDKIAGKNMGSGPDVSREGVQRDILPIVEGCTVATKYGPVKTDYMLFIAAGAFHVSKVSDLIPELQGRFPIRVNLSSLSKEDLRMILTQPQSAAIKQYAALLDVDHVKLTFTDGALDMIADYAQVANEVNENIGARRLHTVLESLLDDISFNSGGNHPPTEVVIDEKYVHEHLGESEARDLRKYIL